MKIHLIIRKDFNEQILMNKVEYLIEIMKIDVKRINSTEQKILDKKCELEKVLLEAEERCDLYEEMYENDLGMVMLAYTDYENVRRPITSLESFLLDYKLDLINHYEQFLIEKNSHNDEISKALAISKFNIKHLDETVNIIKGILT